MPARSSSWFLLQRHPGGTAKAVYGEATYSQAPRDGRRPTVHDLPCEASRSAKMGEGRSDRNLYAHVGAARRRNQPNAFRCCGSSKNAFVRSRRR